MIALGDDCAASGGEMAETLQYYRRAQSAAREVPDIAYTPQVCLRLAQYETQYLSRKKALLQVAKPCRGFGSCRLRAKRMLPTGCGRLNC